MSGRSGFYWRLTRSLPINYPQTIISGVRHGLGRDTDRPRRQAQVHREVPGPVRSQAVRGYLRQQARSEQRVAARGGAGCRRPAHRPAAGTADLPPLCRGEVAPPSCDGAHHQGEVHLLPERAHHAGVRPDADHGHPPRACPCLDHQDAGQKRLRLDDPVRQVRHPQLGLHHPPWKTG